MGLGPVKTPWELRAKTVLDWGCLIVFGASLLLWLLGRVSLVVWPVVGAVLVGAFVIRWLGYRGRMKQLAALRKIDFRVCPGCSYDLRALEAEGVCPECGKAFTQDTLADDWKWFFSAPPRPRA
jgi:hypothetical protein